MRAAHDQPYWCEENAWHLCASPQLGIGAIEVAIITNALRTVGLWHQRAAARADAAVVWDYHVIVLADAPGGMMVWDLDTTLGFPEPASRYLAQTFRSASDRLAPSFRVLSAAEYRRQLASDRRHMRDETGGWLQPPPPWPPIGSGHNLPELLDLERATPGAWLSLEQLRSRALDHSKLP
jgi:protein N-terminal glutamine amidohydrolase